MGYTQHQFDRAKTARKLYVILGMPTVENFKNILHQNIIKNCPVTVEDVNIAERIFGPDVAAIKGRATRPKPPIVHEEQVEIPQELIM